MDIVFMLLFFLLIFGLCVRVAVRGNEEAERAQDDAQGVDGGLGWISGGWDGELVP